MVPIPHAVYITPDLNRLSSRFLAQLYSPERAAGCNLIKAIIFIDMREYIRADPPTGIEEDWGF
jgi:hypothetical protein